MNYIQVTGAVDGSAVYINTDRIFCVNIGTSDPDAPPHKGMLQPADGGGILVKETPEEIMLLISGAERQEREDTYDRLNRQAQSAATGLRSLKERL